MQPCLPPPHLHGLPKRGPPHLPAEPSAGWLGTAPPPQPPQNAGGCRVGAGEPPQMPVAAGWVLVLSQQRGCVGGDHVPAAVCSCGSVTTGHRDGGP